MDVKEKYKRILNCKIHLKEHSFEYLLITVLTMVLICLVLLLFKDSKLNINGNIQVPAELIEDVAEGITHI